MATVKVLDFITPSKGNIDKKIWLGASLVPDPITSTDVCNLKYVENASTRPLEAGSIQEGLNFNIEGSALKDVEDSFTSVIVNILPGGFISVNIPPINVPITNRAPILLASGVPQHILFTGFDTDRLPFNKQGQDPTDWYISFNHYLSDAIGFGKVGIRNDGLLKIQPNNSTYWTDESVANIDIPYGISFIFPL